MRILAAAALCALAAGCAGDRQVAESPTQPLSFDEARGVILAQRGRIWKDPASIRDAQVGQPHPCSGGLAHVGDMPNACICVEANARNGFGGYTGLQKTEILLNGPRIVDMMMPPRMSYPCGAMAPFPELNGDFVAATPAAPAPPAKRRPAT